MSRLLWAAFAVTMALLAGCAGSRRPADSPTPGPLEGSWEITSVRRDGESDPVQVGAVMEFAGHALRFHPKVAQFALSVS